MKQATITWEFEIREDSPLILSIEVTRPEAQETHPRDLPAFAPGATQEPDGGGGPMAQDGGSPNEPKECEEEACSDFGLELTLAIALGAKAGESVLDAAKRVVWERDKFDRANRRCEGYLEHTDRLHQLAAERADALQVKIDKIALEVMR